MFKLIPQLVVLLSLAVIVVMILRRLPEVTVREETELEKKDNQPVASGPRNWRLKLQNFMAKAWNFLYYYLSAAKDHTSKDYLGRVSKALRLDKIPSPLRFRFNFPTSTTHLSKPLESAKKYDDSEEAEKSLIEIIKKHPNSRAAYESLGKLYLERQKYQDALEVYKYLSGHHPEQDLYWSKLGMAFFNLQNYEKAAASYQRAIGIRSDLPNRYINLALCFEALGNLDQAAEAVIQALELSAGNVQYLHLLADLYIRLENKARAEEILEKILESEPTNNSAREKLMQLKF